MKRSLGLVLTLAAVGLFLAGVSSASARPRFQVRCFSSHIAAVDPIVAPGTRSAHQHEFFGNETTNKNSTYRSMIAGSTNCSTTDDTAGYWTPTLFRPNGSIVRAQSLLIYYRGTDVERTRAFPPNLQMISDRFALGADESNLIVKFPECWDGVHLDSGNHRSHMAFAGGGKCPASHPVRVPSLTEVFRYPVASVAGFHLSSGGFSTGHADFWNTWRQPGLVDLVQRCLLPGRTECGRIDS